MRQSALFAALVALMSVEARDRTFTIINQCTQPIWTGIFNTDGHPPMVFADNAQKTTGFKLESNGGKKRLTAPDQWGGRIWPRTNCKQQGGQFVCQSGNCPGTDENCTQTGEVCTLAEFSLFPENGDWYNLSLVDGFNIPMQIKLSKTTAECPNLTCSTDILKTCPKQLLDFGGSVCSSACKKKLALGSYKNLDTGAIVKGDRNCCTGPFDVPGTCPAEGVDYYNVFKSACPDAYAHAYDDKKSLQQCPKSVQPDYTITFCPAPAPSYLEQKAAFDAQAGGQKAPAEQQQQPSKRTPISMLASHVCIPPGYTLVEGGGEVKPTGECGVKSTDASAEIANSPPDNDDAAPPAASAPAPLAPENQGGEDAGKALTEHGDPTAVPNPPGAAGNIPAESSTGAVGTATLNGIPAPSDIPAAPGTEVFPLGEQNPDFTGAGGPPAEEPVTPPAPPSPPAPTGYESKPEDNHAKPKKAPCPSHGKKKHAGMKRMEEDPRR
ncbi:hypothetical protein NCC49_004426 [Naganishia albida]|nr:hypothetical protein NCC49_004426 [Naganishia albida]